MPYITVLASIMLAILGLTVAIPLLIGLGGMLLGALLAARNLKAAFTEVLLLEK